MALAIAPILDIEDPNELFVLETNASGNAIGAILMQGGCPIAFESKKRDRAQRNYSTYERELLVIVHAVKKWQHYEYDTTFEVQTDHESMKWLSCHKELTGRKAHWEQILQEFDPWLRYQKGKIQYCGTCVESYAYGK